MGSMVSSEARSSEESGAWKPMFVTRVPNVTGTLKDPTLREHAPAEYWEARYHWLRHQLRHGHNGKVISGIETEKVWHPDLGGPPWQARLLELAEQARAVEETPGP